MTWLTDARKRVQSKSMVDLHPEVLERQHIMSLRSDEAPQWSLGYSYLDALGDYECYVWVRKAIKVIAENFAALPLSIRRGEKDERAHSLLDLLTSVNDVMSSADLWQQYIVDMLLGGEEAWELVRNGRGRYVEVWPRQPHTLKIVPDTARRRYFGIAQYILDDQLSGAEPYSLPPEELVHFKFYNPRNPWRGLSPLNAVRLSIVIDQFAQVWSRLFFRNSARPDYAVITPSGTTQTERDEIKKQLMAKFGGVVNAHEPVVLEQGVTDIKMLSYPPKDLEWIEQRKISREEVGAIFGVPDEIMGWGRDTYENFDTALRVLWQLTIVPLTRHRDTHLTEFFQRMRVLKPDEMIVTDLSGVAVLQEDFGKKVEQAGLLFGMGYSPNVINERLQLGLPDIPGGDVGYLPLALVPIGTPMAPPVEPGKALKAARGVEFGGDEHTRLYDVFTRRLTPNQRRVRRTVVDIFEQQRDDVKDRLRNARDPGDIAADPLDRDEWDPMVAALMLPVLIAVLTNAGDDALDDLGLDAPFDGELPDIVQAMREQAQTFAERVDEETWERLRSSLADGVEGGEGVNRLMERVEEVMAERIRSSSETIARTETIRATSTGTLEAWGQSEIVERKVWISALIPGRSREDHMAAHGQEVALGEDFDIGGVSTPGPGMSGVAEVDINCLCSMTPVVSKARRFRPASVRLASPRAVADARAGGNGKRAGVPA